MLINTPESATRPFHGSSKCAASSLSARRCFGAVDCGADLFVDFVDQISLRNSGLGYVV